jgi:hypothetical protein
VHSQGILEIVVRSLSSEKAKIIMTFNSLLADFENLDFQHSLEIR